MNITTVGRRVLREGEVALRRAPCHLHVDQALDEAVAADELLLQPRPFLGGVGIRDADLAQAAIEPGEMGLVVHETTVQDRAHLVDAVREQEAAIVDRDASLLEGEKGAVDEHDAGQGRAPSRRLRADGAPKHERMQGGKQQRPSAALRAMPCGSSPPAALRPSWRRQLDVAAQADCPHPGPPHDGRSDRDRGGRSSSDEGASAWVSGQVPAR